ncbi:family 16 glycosylhydrolase [Virgisporangium ochraceum]|uniref:Glycoside hydrolase family 16 n=1 Tax=Virgisporangium ochraceum TaxID=65505 RepID=A0A8J3ZWT2_9ACTN|nr:family 16 glycosylhydrolase [Virgisporangium ochraceum]GIJ70623.1 hypothetical protein Voc01_055400 [Virgisporangium ochraceum]
MDLFLDLGQEPQFELPRRPRPGNRRKVFVAAALVVVVVSAVGLATWDRQPAGAYPTAAPSASGSPGPAPGPGSAPASASAAARLYGLTATVLNPDQVRIDWTGGSADATGWTVARDGTDDNGFGPWSTVLPATARTHTFNILVAGFDYTFTLTPRTATGAGEAARVTANTNGTSTGPVASPSGPTDPPSSGGGTPPGDGATAAATQNWGTPAWSEDFDGTALGPDWGAYDDPTNQHGNRQPGQCRVSGGMLRLVSEPDNRTCGVAHRKNQTYGRWEGRVRSSGSGWMSLFIIWPHVEEPKWPALGEYDWREHEAGARCFTGFHHYPDHTPKRQEQLPERCAPGGTSEWHNVAFEWTATRMAGWIDGALWYEFDCASLADLCRMPAGHVTIQNDNQGQANGRSAITEVAWIRGWEL